MASFITSLIGAMQGRSAIQNAAGYMTDAERRAMAIIKRTIEENNGYIQGTADGAANDIKGASADAADASLGTAANAVAGMNGAVDSANGRLQPYIDSGNDASVTLRSLLAPGGDLNRSFGKEDFQADPGYQNRLDEGQKAIARMAAARGSLLGGSTLKSMTRFNSGLAAEEYGKAFDRFNTQANQRFNRLSTVSGMGETAAHQAGQNTIGGETFAGNVNTAATRDANNYRVGGTATANQYRLSAADTINKNSIYGGTYQAEGEKHIGGFQASSAIGSAQQWNQFLGALGKGGDAFAKGGSGGDGGSFSWTDAIKALMTGGGAA